MNADMLKHFRPDSLSEDLLPQGMWIGWKAEGTDSHVPGFNLKRLPSDDTNWQTLRDDLLEILP